MDLIDHHEALQALEGCSDILGAIIFERARQNKKWGEQNFPNGTGGKYMQTLANANRARCENATKDGVVTFMDIMREEVYEAFAESDPVKLRQELIQVCALGIQWIEAIDRVLTKKTSEFSVRFTATPQSPPPSLL